MNGGRDDGPATLARILGDRRLRAGAAPWFFASLVLLHLLVARWVARAERERERNLLVDATAHHGTPRWDWSVGESLDAYWGRIPDAREHPLVIVSGMSQMYAVNDRKPEDRIIAELLDDALAGSAVRAFGLAAPNLDNEEALVYLAATLDDPRTRPAAFVYGLCFDKYRNVDLRPALRRFLAARPGVRARLGAACGRHAGTHPAACAKLRETVSAAEVPEPAAAEDRSLEGRLRAAAGVVSFVGARELLNADLQAALYDLRNRTLGIDAHTKRPIIESRYALNKELLDLLVTVALEEKVTPIFYVIPLNPGGDPPYVPAQYQEFKAWAERFAKERGVPFANLEGVVPAADWGVTEQGPDYKHFRGEGHRKTAAALLSAFGPLLGGLPRRGAEP